ncbi:hypothetical protein FisN_8Lh325 [Fistulifera solaris]|uniref:Uncharacterized protein n=1 Tax=Fistulifera solaris TaxID=1519565 RepID=A0A1Z5JNM6_FISSO|nr:hypothetical protein FisN_8Lh325 [Fistulifera solaris]|eukprot:GAX15381.1 hypothetical protein FisN_8Lh325 [Fistulifera solaris]
MLFREEDSLWMDLSISDEPSSASEDKVAPGTVVLPHDLALESQQIDLTPITSTMPHLDERDLFLISDADTIGSSSECWTQDESDSEGPSKRFKGSDVLISPISVCTLAQSYSSIPLAFPQACSDPKNATRRYYNQLALLTHRMRQSEESRQKVAEYRQRLAHVYESVKSPEASLFTSSKKASAYHQSRLALLASLSQVMNESSASPFVA